MSRCGRSAKSLNAVIAFDFCWSFASAALVDGGDTLSFSPEMMSSGARSSFAKLTLVGARGLKFASAAWNITRPGPGTA